MSTPFQKILLVTNQPCDTVGAEQTALNFAKSHSSEVMLVDTIRTPFNASRYPRISAEVMFEAATNAKNEYLQTIQTQFVQDGIEATYKVLTSPRTSAELIRTVIDEEVDLVVRYLKGASSRAAGRFGETAQNLMRACPCPVLLTEKEIKDPKVVACINLDHGPEENQAILENARRLVSSSNNLLVLCCWEFSGRDFVFEYMDEGMVEETREEAAELYRKMFDRLHSEYSLDDLNDQVFLRNQSPVTAIPAFCKENDVDVAVMCSASLNHPLGRKLGSTIERTIGKLPCSLLTVKPIGFQSNVETAKLSVAAEL